MGQLFNAVIRFMTIPFNLMGFQVSVLQILIFYGIISLLFDLIAGLFE